MPTDPSPPLAPASAANPLPLVERARRYLAATPPAVAGQRGHDAAFRAACTLIHGFALDESTAFALLGDWNTRCRPPWSPTELAHKTMSALAAPSLRPRGYLLGDGVCPPPVPRRFPGSLPPALESPKWPAPGAALIAEITAAGPTALELWKKSPHRLDVDDGSHCESIVEALFATPGQPDPLLCVGHGSREFATRPLSEWLAARALPACSLIVPSPMSAPTGRTREGRASAHTLENTGPRRFLVVEFDQGSIDAHAARLWHLAGFARLALVVHSGGRSLHGWFPCAGRPEEDVRRFLAYAVRIGADKATWTRSQFVRLPAGRRDTGCRQSVFYYHPALLTAENNPAR